MPERHKGNCHCGTVKFEVELDLDKVDASRCDCSFCKRRQVAAVGVPLSAFKITNGEEYLTLYQWGTKTAEHYFCRICGIYTHHKRRSDPNQYGFNVACIESINPFQLQIKVTDGVNHPSDRD